MHDCCHHAVGCGLCVRATAGAGGAGGGGHACLPARLKRRDGSVVGYGWGMVGGWGVWAWCSGP